MEREVKTLELTFEDVLLLHRGWITKLFVEDKKTEVEIVVLLYERQFSIALELLRKCLQEWDLLSSPSSAGDLRSEPEHDVHSVFNEVYTEFHIDTHSASDGWEVVYSHSRSHTISRTCLSPSLNNPLLPDSPTYTPLLVTADIKPENINLYKERPLPSLPSTTAIKKRRKSTTSLDRTGKDKLKLTCYHGPEFHEVEMSLGILGQGPSPIETYATEDQSHERLAMGLNRVRRVSDAESKMA